MFSTACALPSPTSVEGFPPLFGWFTGVGSEVAHQVSMLATVRRPNPACSFPAHGFHEDSTIRGRKEGINPTRFTSPYSPKSVAVGSCFQPQLRQRLNRCDQMRRTIHRSGWLKSFGTWARLLYSPQPLKSGFSASINARSPEAHAASCAAAPHLCIFETPDRFLARVGIEPTRACPAADLSRRKKKSLSALDLVAEELEAVLNMNDPRLLRMQIHAQLFQDAASSVDGCSRLCRGLAGDYPIVRVPRQLIPLVSHLPIKRRQEDVAEQG
jgi:hypothetical protein